MFYVPRLVSSSLSRPWGSSTINEDFSQDPFSSPAASLKSNQKLKPKSVTPTASMFSEFLSPSSSSNSSRLTSNPPPTSTDKKKHKGFFHSPLRSKKSSASSSKIDKSKSAADLTNVGTGGFGLLPDAGASAPSLEEVHLHMASEASRRAEDDRMRRIRIQEEQDLAYAIALSKAEAASLAQK